MYLKYLILKGAVGPAGSNSGKSCGQKPVLASPHCIPTAK